MAALLEKRSRGVRFNDSVRNLRQFQNPYMLDNAATLFDIDQHGSNYPEHIYDPHAAPPDDHYEALAEAHRQLQAARSTVSFRAGGTLHAQASTQRGQRR